MKKYFSMMHLVVVCLIPNSGCMKLTSIGEQYYGSGMNSSTLTWLLVDGAGTNGINRDPAQGAAAPQTTVLNNKLYAIWVESNGSRGQVRVSVYNGNSTNPTWSFVDGASLSTGLNYNSAKNGDTPQLIAFNSRLYATWTENNTNTNTPSQVRVMVYNGNDAAPAWTFVDGNTNNGLNFNNAKDASVPRLCVFSGALYITWTENNSGVFQIHVYRYNGNDSSPAWTAVDNAVASATGINKDTSKDATNSVLVTLGSKLYAIWAESNAGKDQIRVALYPGSATTWTTFVDGGSLNRDATRFAAIPEACVLSGKLYVVWREYNANAYQARLAVYNGNDSAPAWTFVDGGGTNGLNKDPAKAADQVHCTVFNSRLYLTWQETNSATVNQVRVAVYNGNDAAPSVSFADGAGDKGINKDTSLDAQNPRLNVFNSELFAIWTENNSVPRKQVRVASGL